MKIYFAGSIRGGRDDKELYSNIIELLKKHGELLSEHVGDGTIDHMGVGEHDSAEFILARNMVWMKEADVVIAEVTTPSLGVGYELGIAETLNKRVLCLYRDVVNRSLSAMIRGNKAFKVEEYKNIEDLSLILKEFFK